MIKNNELKNLFLDDGVQIQVNLIRNKHKKLYDIIMSINLVLAKIEELFKNKKIKNKEVYLYSMFYQIHCSYQSYIILLERGLYDDSQVILRSICDKIIMFIYVNDNEDNYYKLGQATINNMIKNYKYMLGTKIAKLVGEDVINRKIEELEMHQTDKSIKLPIAKVICENHSMKDLYCQYSMLSDYTHENLSILMENNTVVGSDVIIGKGFRYDDINNDVYMIVCFLEIIITKMCSILEVDEYLNEFDELKIKLILLCNEEKI